METTQIGLVPLHNQPLDRDDFPIEKVEGGAAENWNYTARKNQYVPSAEQWERVDFPRRTRDELTAFLDNPPKTVGALIYDYLHLKSLYLNTWKDLCGLHEGLGEINGWLNKYAEEENMCVEYEATLDRFNEMLTKHGYRQWFRFEGRKEDIMVTVQRRRTILETTTVCVSMTRNDMDSAYEDAIDVADGIDNSDWTEIDDCYSVDDYEAIDYETV